MTDLDVARTRWLQERPKYVAFGKLIAEMLKEGVRKEGLWADVSSRAKDLDSLIRKLIKKDGKHTYDSLGDKSGVRVVVRYLDEIAPVISIAERLLSCTDWENKVTTLGPDTLGYLSTHGDVRLLPDDAKACEYPPKAFRAELQVRTLSQHLWSEMSHDSFYKNDSMLNPIAVPLQRRVYLLAGMVEIADHEFNRLGSEIVGMPELEILRSLERHYYKYSANRGDAELSLQIIRLMLPIYGQSIGQVKAHLDEFLEERKDTVAAVYESTDANSESGALLRQPEALMLYDLLKQNEARTREVWNTEYPEKELERVAIAFGMSFD
jgi:ppGpp synthetase/RelA/SpoT-type nucleotidyltranferase